MSLPITSVVNVNVVISSALPPKRGFGVAAVVSKELTILGSQQQERIKYYGSISEVAIDWSTSSETYKVASTYFGQSPSPVRFAVIANYDAGSNAILFGGNAPNTDVPTWAAIGDGSLNVTIDANSIDVVGIDTTSVTSMADVSATIQTAIRAADASFSSAIVSYNTVNQRFEINGGVVGGTINYTSDAVAGTPISEMLDSNSLGTAVLQQGVGAESIVNSLTEGEQANSEWYGILLLKGERDTAEVLNVAAWAEARTKIFSTSTNDPTTLQIGATANNAYQLKNSGYTRTCMTYSGDSSSYPDSAVLGRAFTTNFDSPDSVITMKFKQLANVPTENINSSQKAGLDEKRCNVLVDVAGQSMYAEGFMSSSLFFDERHGVDWLIGEIESNSFNYLISRTTKVPLTDKGGAALQQQVVRSLDAGVSNGLIGTGVTSEGEFLGNGYKTSVGKVYDMNSVDRANRSSPPITFTALLTRAVHFVQVDGIVER